MKIIIHPFSRKLRNGKLNPKVYPHWNSLIKLLKSDNHTIVQVGEEGEEHLVDDFRTLSLKELKKLILECDTFICVDSFLQHLTWRLSKSGIVLFGQSDPKIFGHEENINLYSDEKYFRQYQFQTWEECEYIKEAFVSPEEVIKNINTYKNLTKK